VFLAAVWTVRKDGSTVQHTFALAIVVAVLIGYHTMPYDLSLLFPVAIFLFAAASQTESGRDWEDMALLFVLFLTPLYVLLRFHLSRFGWFALPLIWLFWRLSRAAAPSVFISGRSNPRESVVVSRLST
jgi:hypothetical protein